MSHEYSLSIEQGVLNPAQSAGGLPFPSEVPIKDRPARNTRCLGPAQLLGCRTEWKVPADGHSQATETLLSDTGLEMFPLKGQENYC